MSTTKSSASSIIIGIDPGTVITGYGIILVTPEGFKPLDFGCIRPPLKFKLSDRYLVIFQALGEILEKFSPDVLVVETQYVKKNVQSAIKLGMARGIVIVAAKLRKIPIIEYSPTKAKKAVTGNGFASKYQVQGMVRHLLNLKEIPQPEDAADALALAICHGNSLNINQLFGEEI